MISSYHLLFLMWPDFYVDSENQFGYGMEIKKKTFSLYIYI